MATTGLAGAGLVGESVIRRVVGECCIVVGSRRLHIMAALACGGLVRCTPDEGWATADLSGRPWGSGERLRAIVWEAEGGAAKQVGWYDRQRDAQCRFVRELGSSRDFGCAEYTHTKDDDVHGVGVAYDGEVGKFGVYRVEMEDGSFQDLNAFDTDQGLRCNPGWEEGISREACELVIEGYLVYGNAGCSARRFLGPYMASEYVAGASESGSSKFGPVTERDPNFYWSTPGCTQLEAGFNALYRVGDDAQPPFGLERGWVGDGPIALATAGNVLDERLLDGTWHLTEDGLAECTPYMLPNGVRRCIDTDVVTVDPPRVPGGWLDAECIEPAYSVTTPLPTYVGRTDRDDRGRLESLRPVVGTQVDVELYRGEAGNAAYPCAAFGPAPGPFLAFGEETDLDYPEITEYIE